MTLLLYINYHPLVAYEDLVETYDGCLLCNCCSHCHALCGCQDLPDDSRSLFRILQRDIPDQFFKIEEYITLKRDLEIEDQSEHSSKESESDSSGSDLVEDVESLKI